MLARDYSKKPAVNILRSHDVSFWEQVHGAAGPGGHMTSIRFLMTGLFAVAVGVVAVASDPTAVYARVDKVVLEPAGGSPETIQLWGVFSLAKPNDRNDYLPPARGYLYFKLMTDAGAARKEWADFQQVAGTGQIVSFGSRYALQAQLRRPNERPGNPDPYATSIGLTKIRGNTEYGPIRALLDFRN
jgi:hypothetical protein